MVGQSTMQQCRQPAVAGTFYPDDPLVLDRMLESFLEGAPARELCPKALVAPHAGYVYSGPIAGAAYRALAPSRDRIRRVVLLGPSHRVYFKGLALSSALTFETPLGRVPIDTEAGHEVAAVDAVQILDAAHAQEHSLEVHLPFLQRTLEEFKLVPIVVGEADPATVARVIARLWGGAETLIVVSSDLSHYLDYETAVRVDRETTGAIEDRRDDIRPDQACGCRPLNGLLHLARSRDLLVSTLDVRNSGDTAGSRDRVVGYGAYSLQ